MTTSFQDLGAAPRCFVHSCEAASRVGIPRTDPLDIDQQLENRSSLGSLWVARMCSKGDDDPLLVDTMAGGALKKRGGMPNFVGYGRAWETQSDHLLVREAGSGEDQTQVGATAPVPAREENSNDSSGNVGSHSLDRVSPIPMLVARLLDHSCIEVISHVRIEPLLAVSFQLGKDDHCSLRIVEKEVDSHTAPDIGRKLD